MAPDTAVTSIRSVHETGARLADIERAQCKAVVPCENKNIF